MLKGSWTDFRKRLYNVRDAELYISGDNVNMIAIFLSDVTFCPWDAEDTNCDGYNNSGGRMWYRKVEEGCELTRVSNEGESDLFFTVKLNTLVIGWPRDLSGVLSIKKLNFQTTLVQIYKKSFSNFQAEYGAPVWNYGIPIPNILCPVDITIPVHITSNSTIIARVTLITVGHWVYRNFR